MVSIIIVNYNTKDLTQQCINSVIETTKGTKKELIVVDNASTDGSVLMLEKLSTRGKIKLIKSKKNLGFSGGNNLGIKASEGEYVLLLNSDTIIQDDAISVMVDWMEKHPKVGIATCSLKGKDGKTQAPGGNFPTLLRVISWMTIEDIPFVDNFIKPFHPKKYKHKKPTQYDWVTGTFFLVRKEVINQIGMLDTNYFMYTEEVDFCFRARKKGWHIYYVPLAEIIHLGMASSSNRYALVQEAKGIKLFYKKHFPSWQFSIMTFFLKIGSLLRAVAYTLIGKREIARTYFEILNNV